MLSLKTLAPLAGLVSLAFGANYTQVTDYGDNPAGVDMYIYVPDKLASPPPVVLGIHWCHGSAEEFYSSTQWKTQADSKGFIVIYPDSPHTSDKCWDVASNATLTHGGGGDSNSLANMVEYTIDTYDADADLVFVTGVSSGAMMTNVMAAVYPGLFKAASAQSGVAAGCFASADDVVDEWNEACATGTMNKTQEEWAAVVAAMGGSAPYPKMQIFHGSADDVLDVQNFEEEIKQWTGVFGVSDTPTSTEPDTPEDGYTLTNYGENVQAIYAEGVGHNLPDQNPVIMGWFDL